MERATSLDLIFSKLFCNGLIQLNNCCARQSFGAFGEATAKVYGSDALPAFSTDLPLQTFSSFEQAADALRETAEVPPPMLFSCFESSSLVARYYMSTF